MNTPVKTQIGDAYARWAAAFKRKDLRGCMEVLTPDFTWQMPDGQSLDRQGVEAALREQIASFASIDDVDITLEAVTVDAGQATVSLREKVAGTTGDAAQPPRAIVSSETYRDTWVETEQGWRLRTSELLTTQTWTGGEEA